MRALNLFIFSQLKDALVSPNLKTIDIIIFV